MMESVLIFYMTRSSCIGTIGLDSHQDCSQFTICPKFTPFEPLWPPKAPLSPLTACTYLHQHTTAISLSKNQDRK